MPCGSGLRKRGGEGSTFNAGNLVCVAAVSLTLTAGVGFLTAGKSACKREATWGLAFISERSTGFGKGALTLRVGGFTGPGRLSNGVAIGVAALGV